MTKVLVTGGLGFIGSNLVEGLGDDIEITVIDNLSSARKDYQDLIDKNNKVEYVIDSYGSDRVLKRVASGEFDCVFHLAAIPRVSYSVEQPVETTDNNVLETVKLIDAFTKSKKGRFVFSSSSSVYGGADVLPTPSSTTKSPKSPYAWQKSTIEDFIKIMCSLHGSDMISLRYFNVFGPGQYGGSAYSTAVSAWCHAIKNKTQLRKDGTGEQSRDMCYVDNTVQANILAMKSERSFSGECFNVACGDRTSNNEILSYFENKFGKLNIQQAPFRPGDVMHTQADITDTVEALGYNPSVRFWEGLERTLGWWNLND